MGGRGKLLLAWGLLLALPLAGLFLQGRIDALCRQIDVHLAESQTMAEGAPLEKAIDLWLDHQRLLTALVTHEEVDAVTESLRKALAFLYADNPEEFYAALREAEVDLGVVRQFDRLSIRSIF